MNWKFLFAFLRFIKDFCFRINNNFVALRIKHWSYPRNVLTETRNNHLLNNLHLALIRFIQQNCEILQIKVLFQ